MGSNPNAHGRPAHLRRMAVSTRPERSSPISVVVLTLPILPGRAEAWRRFCQELAGSRAVSYAASRRRLGVTRERMALVESAFGATATMTLESPDIGRVLAELISSDLPFDGWYREQTEYLYGVQVAGYEDFAQPVPASPLPELLFEWNLNEG